MARISSSISFRRGATKTPSRHKTGSATMIGTKAEQAHPSGGATPERGLLITTGRMTTTMLWLVFLAGLVGSLFFWRSMSGGMAMPGGWTMSMMWMRMPGQSWPASIGMFLLMWLAMMLAMMLPSAAPMLSSFGTGRAAALVGCGYFCVWLGVGLVVYGIGVAWGSAAMRWRDLSEAAPWLTGAMLATAGALQLGRLK